VEQQSCTECGAANPADHQFCGGCGAPLTIGCPACGAVPSSTSQRFCGKCGAALATSTIGTAEPAAPRRGELRRVTVVFVDLVGWTSLSEAREPEDLRELLSGYFDLARTLVERYGGTVEKFIGDAVLAVWGAQAAREDDPERAVRASLELVGAIPAYGAEAGAPGLLARAGVVTGQVAAVVKPGEGIVVGDRVNTGARVQSAAEPGQVLVDEVTRRLTESGIAYVEAGWHQAKGKAEPLQLWRAERIVARVGGGAGGDSVGTRLVGRERELALVKEVFHSTADQSRARMLLVTGVAGVGKSRLRWEFSTYVDGVAGSVFWHLGRCVAYGEDVSFAALAEMLRDRFGIDADADPAAVRDRISTELGRWVPEPSERVFLTPRLAALVGASDGTFGRQELFGAWRSFFQRLALTSPVVLVFEDLHWADDPLLDFIEHLLDFAGDSRLFLLALTRSDLADRRPGWLAERHNVARLHLDGLPDPAMGELVDGLVGGLPEDQRGRIVAHADGIPLYAVETVRSLVDRGVVVVDEGRYRLVGDVGELGDVPDSLAGLISARLDALPDSERSLVRDLAVLGQSFSRQEVSLAAGASGLDEDLIDGLLAALRRKQVLTVRDDPLSMSRGHFVFVQSMLRTVAYDTLSRRDRRAKHLRLAEQLAAVEGEAADQTAELVAGHYQRAFLADPDAAEAADARQRAVLAFEQAARRASSVGAPDAAEEHFRTAASLAVNEAERTRLVGEQGQMAIQAGRPSDALVLFEEVIAAHERADRPEAALRSHTFLTFALLELGRTLELVDRVGPALRALDHGSPDADVAQLEAASAMSLFWLGRPEEAVALNERALTTAAGLQLDRVEAFGGSMRGLYLASIGRFGESLAVQRWALEAARRGGDLGAEYHVHGNIDDHLIQADKPDAEESTLESLELTRRLGDRTGESFVLSNLSVWRLHAGRWDEAEADALMAVGIGGVENTMLWSRARLMQLYLYRGQDEQAHAEAVLVQQLRELDDVQQRPVGLAAESLVARLEGDLDHAVATAMTGATEAAAALGLMADATRLSWTMAAEASVLAGRDDALTELLGLVEDRPPGHIPPFLEAEAARHRAGLLLRTGGPVDEAESRLRSAVAVMSELGYPYWRALGELDLARLLAADGRGEEAEKPVRVAIETLEVLQAVPALAEAQQVLDSLPTG
jgi:class 3 adenylate cyclase/tetratricopeptide (TPR) repeat protein